MAALESLRCASEAAQSEVVADFVVSQRAGCQGAWCPGRAA